MANQVFNYSGTTTYASAQAQQAFGISDGSKITVTCFYDPSQVPTTGPFAWETNEGTNGFVQIAIGNWSMPPNGDSSGTPGWPLIQFNNGSFAGVNYLAIRPTNGNQDFQFLAEETYWSIQIPGAEPPEIASGTISTQASESQSTGS